MTQRDTLNQLERFASDVKPALAGAMVRETAR
jgi:hypothetical protein